MKLPTQKYNPKKAHIPHSSNNTTNCKAPPRNIPKDDSSKDSAFTDGDDDIFQSIETFETNMEQPVNDSR